MIIIMIITIIIKKVGGGSRTLAARLTAQNRDDPVVEALAVEVPPGHLLGQANTEEIYINMYSDRYYR